MDMILLGLLMMRPQTVYELRNQIRSSFQGVCSDSTGSIQAGVKKLLKAGYITVSEVEAHGVNKKVYYITESGQESFQKWVRTPIDLSKTKNMDVGKLLFMGFAPSELRLPLVSSVIADQQRELAEMEALQAALDQNAEKEQERYLAGLDAGRRLLLEKNTGCADARRNVADIHTYEMLTLQLGIDTAKFHIRWFEELAQKIRLSAKEKE